MRALARLLRLFADDPAFAAAILLCALAAGAASRLGFASLAGPLLALLLAVAFAVTLRRDGRSRRGERAQQNAPIRRQD